MQDLHCSTERYENGTGKSPAAFSRKRPQGSDSRTSAIVGGCCWAGWGTHEIRIYCTDLLTDGILITEAERDGDYVEAVTHFSAIYQEDPHGAIISGLYFWQGNYSVSQAFAEQVWDATWEVMNEMSEYTGLGRATSIPAARSRQTMVIHRQPAPQAIFVTLMGKHILPTQQSAQGHIVAGLPEGSRILLNIGRR